MKDFPTQAQELIQPITPGKREDFLRYLSLPLSKTLTINHQRITHENFLKHAHQNGRKIEPSPRGSHHCFQVQTEEGSPAIGKSRLHQGGFCYIQEAAASIPAQVIRCPAGSHILDMCAAPGGKTTQLAMNNPESIIWANEPSSSRIKALGFNLQRMQCTNTVLTQYAGERFGALFPERFDAVLLDAPCSGEGTNFKSDFSFKFWKKENIKRTSGIQFQLLQSAFKATKPGGVIVYSTCTLNTLENEENVERILKRAEGNLTLKTFDSKEHYEVNAPAGNPTRLWPHIHHTGGFFVAILEKKKQRDKNNSAIKHKEKTEEKTSGKIISSQHPAFQYLEKLGIQLSPNTVLRDTGNTINAIPKHFAHIPHVARFHKVGLPLLKYSTEKKGELRPVHNIVSQYRNHTDHILNLTSEQAQQYCEGKDINLPNNLQDGYVLLKSEELQFSIGKIHNGVLKNKFLR